MLTQERLQELLEYDPDTGKFVWKESRGRVAAGDVAGSVCLNGICIKIDQKNYFAHQLVWLLHHGYFPEEIDHIDLNNINNRLDNLRPCTHSQNLCNTGRRRDNLSGFKGVCWDTYSQKWKVRINKDQEEIYLGLFVSPIDAARAYDQAAVKYHGDFARVNGV